MIEAKELRKRYGDVVAVDGVSFSVGRGEAFGLLGPNGAGKTTILNMLVGALLPDSGDVLLDGDVDPTRPSLRRRLGVSPQGLAIYEELTGEENLRFFGRLYGLGGAQLASRVEWCLEFAGLADRRKQRAGTYSGGMQRRLNLACALVHEPDVLFCDEPTVGVDPQSRNHIFECIEQLGQQGTTLIYTTHYMEEAQRLCDRVAIMDHGHLLAVDTVAALVAQHGGESTVEAELDGDAELLRIRTDEPFEEVAKLAARGKTITRLRVDGPDLERVFLNLTGRRLRD
jgi:ABC-2 type transport system ATP-binding protein